MVSIGKLVDGLCSVAADDFDCDNIYQFSRENPVDFRLPDLRGASLLSSERLLALV
jgi:hypothetical protein